MVKRYLEKRCSMNKRCTVKKRYSMLERHKVLEKRCDVMKQCRGALERYRGAQVVIALHYMCVL